MRTTLVALSLLAASLGPAPARAQGYVDVGVAVRLPSVSIGLAFPAAPALVQVPGHPVFYAPRLGANYFYADDAYWVLSGDRWYSSAWYDGPWHLVEPRFVPSVVLRVPGRYYGRPPVWASGWHHDRPPRWGEHWGRDWERHRGGWDRWDHRQVQRLPPPVARRHDEGRDRDRFDDRGRGRSEDRGRDRYDDHGHDRGGERDRGDDHRGGGHGRGGGERDHGDRGGHGRGHR